MCIEVCIHTSSLVFKDNFSLCNNLGCSGTRSGSWERVVVAEENEYFSPKCYHVAGSVWEPGDRCPMSSALSGDQGTDVLFLDLRLPVTAGG